MLESKILYNYKDRTYSSLIALKNALPANIGVPAGVTLRQLEELGVTVSIAEPTFNEQVNAKKNEIAAARFEAETGGIDFNGCRIATDRESQSLLTGAALAAVLDNSYSLKWKTDQGFINLTAAEVLAAANAVRAHVQACFDREAELLAAVEEAETLEELEAVIWNMIEEPAEPDEE